MTDDPQILAARYRPLSRALLTALAPDPFYAALETRCDASHGPSEAMLRYYDLSMHEATRYGRLTRIGDDGVAVWLTPLASDRAASKRAAKKSTMTTEMGAAAWDLYDRIGKGMSRNSDTIVDGSDWYLSILGLRPERQGQGLGPALLQPVLDEADHEGVATYLETFVPRNEGFYRRQGYEVAGRFREPVTGADYAVMRRLPR